MAGKPLEIERFPVPLAARAPIYAQAGVPRQLGPGSPPWESPTYPGPQPRFPDAEYGWFQDRRTLIFTGNIPAELGAGVGFAAVTWGPFNLRPGMKAAAGVDPQGVLALPRPDAYGQGLGLHVRVDGLGAVTSDLEVFVTEWASPWDPTDMRAVSARLNVSEDFWDGQAQSALFSFEPPGLPVWFWSVSLEILQLTGNLGDVQLTTVVGAY